MSSCYIYVSNFWTPGKNILPFIKHLIPLARLWKIKYYNNFGRYGNFKNYEFMGGKLPRSRDQRDISLFLSREEPCVKDQKWIMFSTTFLDEESRHRYSFISRNRPEEQDHKAFLSIPHEYQLFMPLKNIFTPIYLLMTFCQLYSEKI